MEVLRASRNVLREFGLDALLPMMVALRLGMGLVRLVSMPMPVSVSFMVIGGLVVSCLGVYLVVRVGIRIWVLLVGYHLVWLVVFQVPRFMALVRALDTWFAVGGYHQLLTSVGLVVGLCWPTVPVGIIYSVATLPAYVAGDYWAVVSLITETITQITVNRIKQIDRARLYDVVVLEVKMVLIGKLLRTVTDTALVTRIIESVRSLTVAGLVTSLRDVWNYLSGPSDVSLREWLDGVIGYLLFVREWVGTGIPPTGVRYLMILIHRLPLTCCALLCGWSRTALSGWIVGVCCLVEVLRLVWSPDPEPRPTSNGAFLADAGDKLVTLVDCVRITRAGTSTVEFVVETTHNSIKRVTSSAWHTATEYPKTTVAVAVGGTLTVLATLFAFRRART